MRVVKYPEPEVETLITCPKCKAELAYVGSDCYWRDGVVSDLKCVDCPCCKTFIIVEKVPYPIRVGGKIWNFSDGSWAKEVKP